MNKADLKQLIRETIAKELKFNSNEDDVYYNIVDNLKPLIDIIEKKVMVSNDPVLTRELQLWKDIYEMTQKSKLSKYM